jgi:hypothetical protein
VIGRRNLRLALAATAVGAAAALAPAGAAQAATTPTVAVPGYTLTFVPPKMAALSVTIGPVIIGDKVMSPGIHVEMPAIELPTLTVTFPALSY